MTESMLTNFVAEMNATAWAHALWGAFRQRDMTELAAIMDEVVVAQCSPLTTA